MRKRNVSSSDSNNANSVISSEETLQNEMKTCGNNPGDDLFNALYQTCEDAYERGVDSVEIYKALHSKEIFDLVQTLSDQEHKWNKVLWSNIVRKCSALFYAAGILFLVLILNGAALYFLDMNPLVLFPSLAGRACLLPAHPILLEMLRPIQNCSMCSNYKNTNAVVIEYSTLPSESEFRSVAYLSRPIVIRGAAFGTGMPTTFSFAKLRNIFESVPGGVDSAYEDCQFLPFRSPFSTLREAFAGINDTAKWERPWYIGWSNCHPEVAAQLRDIFPRPKFLPSDSESSAIDWIFVGSPGMGAAMHIDFVRRPSWQAQLSGTKQWTLRPVPECEEECASVNLLPIIIQPGDMIFVETNIWYHETMILGENLSISIGSEYD